MEILIELFSVFARKNPKKALVILIFLAISFFHTAKDAAESVIVFVENGADESRLAQIEKNIEEIEGQIMRLDSLAMVANAHLDTSLIHTTSLLSDLSDHHKHAKMKFSCLDSLNETIIYHTGSILANMERQ